MKKVVDLKEAIAKKNKRLSESFVVPILKRIIHEDGINECISVNSHLHGIDFANGALEYFQTKVEVVFSSKVHPNGRYIFAANHPLGGLDGVALISAIGQKFPDLKFPVNDFLLNIDNFDPIFLPVNKHGLQAREAVDKINQAYESSAQILIFPSGLASRKIAGEIKDLPWSKHFIKKAISSKRDVVPVYIDGKNSNVFYLVAKIRKFLGIKFNFEMMLLPREMFLQKGKTIKIVVGKPLHYQAFKIMDVGWANLIRDKVYELRKKCMGEYQKILPDSR